MGDTTSIVVGSLPIFTPILARLFIHEHFRFHDCISIIINIAGIVLIARPEFIFGDTTDAPAIGYIYAILTGLGLAIGTVCGREMSDGQSLLVVIFYNGLCGAILMLILVYPTSSYRMYVLIPQYPITIAYMVAMVAWYILYLYTYNRALQLLSAGKVALLANGSMIVGFIADVTVFNREIVYLEFIGAALIILSAAVVCVLVWFETRKELNENTKLIKN
ncbi:solute carrier family 35 member G1-like [Saccoglossus kowalevskii]